MRHYGSGEKPQALSILKDMLEKEPDRVGLRLQVGWLLVELKRPEEARRLWQSGLERDPENAHLKRALSYLTGEK